MKKNILLLLSIITISCQQTPEKLRYADVERFDNNKIHLTDVEDYYFTLEQILKERRGDLVYVNYWNSYTPYSIELMPALEQLEKEFEGKPFSIINISTDLAMDPFKRHLKISTLKNNYLARNFQNSSFFEEKQIITPRFMLYDKDGNLLDDNAMRPDNENLKETIELLITSL